MYFPQSLRNSGDAMTSILVSNGAKGCFGANSVNFSAVKALFHSLIADATSGGGFRGLVCSCSAKRPVPTNPCS